MTKTIKHTLLFLVATLGVLASAAVYAVDTEAPTLKDVTEHKDTEKEVKKQLVEAAVKGPYDEFYRITPRSSLLALSQVLDEKDFERATNYFDLRNLPFSIEEDINPEELVRKILVVAQRAMVIDVEALSDNPDGHSDDGLPSYRDRVTVVDTQDGPVDILMQRVPRGDGVFIWKISNATVARIPTLYDEFGYGPIGERLSQIFPHYVIMGFEIWQLVMVLALFTLSYIIAFLVTFIIIKLVQVTQRFKKKRLQKFIVGPLRFLIAVMIFRAMFDSIAPSLVARAIFEAKSFLILAIVWVLFGVVDVIINRLADRMKLHGQEDAVVLLKPATTGAKLIIATIGILTWLDNLGFQVTTLLAGLGVGGIAVALAAQKSMENLIGSITIYASQPVTVGDFCKFGDALGTVEEIGLRSTKLRTLGRTVIHIPNAMFASDKIENLAQRDKILYRTRLRLAFDSTCEQVRKVLEGVRELIDQHEFIDAENSRIRFLEYGEYAKELELYVYIKTTDFAEYLEYREDINLSINEIVDASGARLVVPEQTVNINEQPQNSLVNKNA